MRRLVVPLLVFLYAALAGGHIPAGEPSPQGRARAEHQRIVEHWTAGRQAGAAGRDVVLVGPGRERKQPGPSGPAPATSAAWSAGGPVTLTTGRVFFTEDRASFSCSGSVVHSALGSLVMTAGHCVHGGGARRSFATDWVFFPGWTGPTSSPPLGAWTATDLFTTSGWASGESFDDDAGFVVVAGDVGRGSLEQELGASGASAPTLAFDPAPTAGDPVTALGYPAAKRSTGNVLRYCSESIETGLDGGRTVATRCDMGAGSSGGPWFGRLANASDDTGVIRSLTSYGYSSLKGYLFGPILDAAEHAAYDAASTGGCTTGSSAIPCSVQGS